MDAAHEALQVIKRRNIVENRLIHALAVDAPHLAVVDATYLQFLMERDEVSPSVDQAQRLKQISAEGKLENNIIDLIMREEKPLERKVTLRNDRLQKYFPPSYTPKQMEEVILKLLEGWRRRRQQEQAR